MPSIDPKKLDNYIGGLLDQGRAAIPNLTNAAIASANNANINAAGQALSLRHQAAVNFFYALEQETGGSAIRDPLTSSVKSQHEFVRSLMGGYARPTRYYIEFAGVRKEHNERLARNCISVNMPGKALATQPLKIYGPPREYPYDMNFTNELSMSFRIGADFFERDFFESWLNQAISNKYHDVKYSNQYVTNLKIYALDMFDNKIHCSELQDCFCKAIGDIQFSADQTDTIATLDVTLTYSEYFILGLIDKDRRDRLDEMDKVDSFVGDMMNFAKVAQNRQQATEAARAAGARNIVLNR